MTIAAKAAVAAVLVSVAATAALAAELRSNGAPKRYVVKRAVHVDRVVYLDRAGIHCDGGYVYAGPHADACAYPSPLPYARAIDPYYYGTYGPRLRYRYALPAWDYYGR